MELCGEDREMDYPLIEIGQNAWCAWCGEHLVYDFFKEPLSRKVLEDHKKDCIFKEYKERKILRYDPKTLTSYNIKNQVEVAEKLSKQNDGEMDGRAEGKIRSAIVKFVLENNIRQSPRQKFTQIFIKYQDYDKLPVEEYTNIIVDISLGLSKMEKKAYLINGLQYKTSQPDGYYRKLIVFNMEKCQEYYDHFLVD